MNVISFFFCSFFRSPYVNVCVCVCYTWMWFLSGCIEHLVYFFFLFFFILVFIVRFQLKINANRYMHDYSTHYYTQMQCQTRVLQHKTCIKMCCKTQMSKSVKIYLWWSVEIEDGKKLSAHLLVLFYQCKRIYMVFVFFCSVQLSFYFNSSHNGWYKSRRNEDTYVWCTD